MTRKNRKETQPFQATVLEWLILSAPYVIGVYHPWSAALVSTALLLLLSRTVRVQGCLKLSRSPVLLAAAAIPLFLLGGMIWGTDRGMALVGTVQFLPLPLYVLALEQCDVPARMPVLRRVPLSAAVMTLLSAVLSRIPAIRAAFVVNGRLAGFFQYPNSFALFLLVGLVLLLFGKHEIGIGGNRTKRTLLLLVLLGGIALSGSRAVLLILLAVLVFYCLRCREQGQRREGLLLLALMLIGGGAYTVLTGGTSAVGRMLSGPLIPSELLGRLLYARDALPVILRHPLGLGYMGYAWLQGSFQTGVYTVGHVHNELLQLLLDAGWIPAALMLWAVIHSLRCRDGSLCRKLVILVIALHALLDFDTQYVALALILFTALDTDRAERTGPGPKLLLPTAVILAALSLWVGAASFTFWRGNPSLAARIYPAYTTALTEHLQQTDGEEQATLADRVLTLCDHVAVAHAARAEAAMREGNLEAALSERRAVIRLAKYNLDAYLRYLDDLDLAMGVYRSHGDADAVKNCARQMTAVPGMLSAAEAETTALGRRIRDLPALDLPPEYRQRITRASAGAAG